LAAILLAGAALLVPVRSHGQTVDSSLWVPNGPVHALARDGNTLYMGGTFTELALATGGGVPLSPANGFPAGPYPRVLGTVRVAIPDGAGGWFIGGDFTSVGGLERFNLAHTLADGSVAPWAPNPNGTVWTLVSSGGRVYAGGEFTWIGMRWRDRLAALDPVTGVATSWNPGPDGVVRSMALSGSTLYVGGEFGFIAGASRLRLAAFDAGTGALATWDPRANGTVWVLALAGDTLLAGGSFNSVGGSPRQCIAALDLTSGGATSWDPHAGSTVYALAVVGGTVYAGGEFYSMGGQTRPNLAAVDRFTGALRPFDAHVTHTVFALAPSGTTLYAGGTFTGIGGNLRSRLAAVDAATGMALPWDPRPENTVLALAVQGSTVYAGGFFKTIGGIERRNAAAIDVLSGYPTSWNPVATGTVHAIAVGGGTVYVGGEFTGIGGTTRHRIAALDPGSGVATPWDPAADGAVRALAVAGGVVYAGGAFTRIGGQGRNGIAALDVASGYATGWSPGTTGSVYALLVDGGLVYAGGGFSYIGGALRANLAAISVTSGLATPWNPNVIGGVSALALSDGVVYAGGQFWQVGGATRTNLAAIYTGTGIATPWNPGVNGGVNAIAVSGSTVYAGGTFDMVAGQSRSRLAAIDANTGTATVWDPGPDGTVAALAAGGSTVYAGGSFGTIAGRPQPFLAALGGEAAAPAANPTFTTYVSVSDVSVAVGEPVTITATVRNDGADSDDGRIVFSFKDLTDSLDAGRVSSPSAGDMPGFRALPRGTTLLGRDCQPVTASYLVAEYADDDWRGFGAETHTFTATARPRTPGVFSIDVRATLGTAGGASCDYASEMPDGGNTYITDQQGWTVRRFIVYVTDTPAEADPVIGGISLSEQTIVLGQTVTLMAGAFNAGAISDDGRIVLSFPGFTDPLDAQRVALTSTGDDPPGYREWAPGSVLRDTLCQPVTTPCLVAEYADGDWQPIAHETNSLWVRIEPREVGTFAIDVRATMRTANADSCAYVNALPPNGQAGYLDAQDWPVKRFTVTVLAPPVAADPEFASPVSVSADSIVLGQTVTITASVRNLGLASDDGRVVFSFPTLTDTLDGARVTSPASGDYPGFRTLSAGTPLLGQDCQPVTASHLVAEYADNDWRWIGSELNDFAAIVTPREAGDFIVDVRSTMRTAGGAPCDYVSDLPANGQGGFTDQQGWAVKRFVIRVKPTPPVAIPVFTELVGVSTTVVQLGQPVTVTIRVRNDGAPSDDGRIVVSFPAFTAAGDSARVLSSSAGDAPGFRVYPVGAARPGADCQPVTLPYLVAEYADSDWQWLGTEVNTFFVTAYPREVGPFVVDVRATLHTAGAAACVYVNGLPANGVEGGTDPQGWAVRRFALTVSPVPPSPVFLEPVSVSASQVAPGQPVTISAAVRNDGAPGDGRVVVSFPSLTDPLDGPRVSSGSTGDAPGFRALAAGSPLVNADCQPMTAGYLVAEYVDEDWPGFGAETNAVTLTVRPRHAGTFVIEVRASLHGAASDPCAIATAVPPNGQGGGFDQQGWAVRRFFVTVTAPPTVADPVFVGPVLVSTDVMPLGDVLTVTATVRNDGALSDDGRIVVSFPALTEFSDAQWVTGASSGGAPGFRILPAGATVLDRDCQPVAAGYLVAEYAEAEWDSIGDETHTLTLTVRPPRQGLFAVEIRSTMRTAGAGACAYVNDVPSNGLGGFTDQQGWTVRRFDVLVGAPASMTWRPVAPAGGGPGARSAQAAAYDGARDELVLYGGTALSYFADSWALPLDAGATWTPLSPGGPVPLVRIMHSMVFNPVENHLVIFGGYYDHALNDLWILSRTPTTWWFPVDVQGVKPSPRYGHAAIYDPVRQRMLVIGGYDGGLRNDVWEYSPMVNGTWRQLAPTGTPMPPRATHSAVYDPLRDRVLVFGGDGGPFLNDVWALDLGGEPAWERLTPAGAPPAPRREHTAVVHAQSDQMIVFGGFDGTRRVNDVWTLSLSGTPTWERRFASSFSPAPRNLHSAVYDPSRARMVMFGGQLEVNIYSDEVWELTLDATTPVAVALAGVRADRDGVSLTWSGGGAASLAASVERRTVDGEWLALGAPVADGAGRLTFLDREVSPGARYGYRLRVWQGGVEEVLEPVWVTVPARLELALAGATPNPARDRLAVSFTLPERGAGALELFDLRGARVSRHELGALDAGPHRVVLSDGRQLAAGVYLVRLTHAGRTLTAKACVVR
jgi:hypothetical protein